MVKKKINSFEDLEIWQLSHKLAFNIYKVTSRFPRTEIYGLISQIRRAAVSIPSNIVEGYYRNTTKELVQFLFRARGSCGEVICQLVLAYDLEYITSEEYKKLRSDYEVLIRKVTVMIKSLRRY